MAPDVVHGVDGVDMSTPSFAHGWSARRARTPSQQVLLLPGLSRSLPSSRSTEGVDRPHPPHPYTDPPPTTGVHRDPPPLRAGHAHGLASAATVGPPCRPVLLRQPTARPS